MWREVNLGRMRWACLVLAAFAYFVAFPGDLAAVLAPIEAVLGLSRSVATGVYVLLGLLIVARAVARFWGRGRPAAENP